MSTESRVRHLTILISLALTACGGGGGGGGGGTSGPSGNPAPANQAIGGIWQGQVKLTAGEIVSGIGIVTEDGQFYFENRNESTGCAELSYGKLVVSGSSVTGTANTATVRWASDPGVTTQCKYPDGTTSGTSTLSGSVSSRSTITLTSTFRTAHNTTLPSSGPFTLTYNALYERPSSLEKIAGGWVTPLGQSVSITPTGTLSFQDPLSGCSGTGRVSVIDSRYNAYAGSFTYSQCQGFASDLNGVTASGLLALDDSGARKRLYAGYSFTVSSGTTQIIVGSGTQPSVTVLREFDGINGSKPTAPLIKSSDGSFYGTTNSGGAYNYGTVFKITSSGVFTRLHDFDRATSGAYPSGSLLQGESGDLYGTTSEGGAGGYGTIYRISPSGVMTTLHSFGGSDGAAPRAGLARGRDGNYYGTTSSGGSQNLGTVFRVTPAGAFTSTYSFRVSPSPNRPVAGLILGNNDTFFGVTQAGGANGSGAVFTVTYNGIFGTFKSLPADSLGGPNSALVYGFIDGAYYGVMASGVAFKLTVGGVLTMYPTSLGGPFTAGLVQGRDGDFYSTTAQGGTGKGTVFKFTSGGTFTLLYPFTGQEGCTPYAGLVQGNDGEFYGTTHGCGNSNNGTVFRFDP